jgi:hypothetical protein
MCPVISVVPALAARAAGVAAVVPPTPTAFSMMMR